jgi:hypothetical protein
MIVGPELLLTIAMASRATSSPRLRDYLAIEGSYSSTPPPNYLLSCTNGEPCDIEALDAEINRVVADEEMFEGPEEPRPGASTVALAKDLLATAGREMRAPIPECRVSPYYGELDFTWNRDNRLLRLMVFSDNRRPLLYWQVDGGEALTRGESKEATSTEIVERLKWLLG